MSISWQADRTKRITVDALLTATAMMLSYLEVLIPFNLFLPLPGFKPGLANLVTVIVFVWVSKVDALVVLLLRISITSLLFGSITSLWFSLLGGVCAYLALLLASVFLRKSSYWGVSIFLASAHNFGQLVAACMVFGTSVFFSYLPFLCIASLIFGSLTGLLLNQLIPRVGRLLCKNSND